MKSALLVVAFGLLVTGYGCGHTNAGTKAAANPNASDFGASSSATVSAADSRKDSATPAAVGTRVDFPTQIRPILQAKCQPCHFSGGKVYAQMPFDRPETIKTLGTKMFTRIKDENERRLIRDFLAQE